MTADLPRRPLGTVAVHLAGIALLAWLYGGDLALWLEVRKAPVFALSEPPSLVLPVLGLLTALLGVATLALGLFRRRDGSWKGFRIFPLAAVVLLFVDLAVLSSVKVALPSPDRAHAALSLFTDYASANATAAEVPASAEVLERVLPRLGPVPWLVRGEPTRWTIDLRDCEGPAGDAAGRPPGTLIYCRSGDRSTAWVTVVGLPPAQRFGEPAVVSTEAPWVGVVTTQRQQAPSEDDPEAELPANEQ